MLVGADLFVGVSAPGLRVREDIAKMNRDLIVFAMSNPVPEVMPEEAQGIAAVITSGRSDYPNQIHNVPAFPDIIRGALDTRASTINEEMRGHTHFPGDAVASARSRTCQTGLARDLHIHAAATAPWVPVVQRAQEEEYAVANDSLTITDNRTGKSYELPIRYGTYPKYGAAIDASQLRQIKASDDDFGLLAYDPGFTNTASCKSDITFVDGERGILRYRGYPIEQLAEKSSYLETAYLLLYGELPDAAQMEEWVRNITHHTIVHENIKKFIDGFHYDAHPMGLLVGTVGALSTFYPSAKEIHDDARREKQIWRLIAKMPTLAAFSYRHSRGLPYVYPDNDLSYTGNFLSMLRRTTELRYEPDPVLERALDVLFILHADHEQNCSTSAMRVVGSSHPDPYSAIAAATAALYGPLHGGANEAVLRMLNQIGSLQNVPAFVKAVKSGEAGRLMGFGHRVYKNYDPRAKVIKGLADQVFEVTGVNPLLEVAIELERIALEDDYFVERKLYPNVDFYSGIIYQALGFPVAMFPVLFAVPRTAGWLAQWMEMLSDSDTRIARPRQIYTGSDEREYIPMKKRR